MACAGNSLLNRFAGQLSSGFGDAQQQLPTAAALLGGNANSFLDNGRGNESSLLAGFSQQQGGAGGIQSNLRQLEMANDLLVAQRRLSLGLGTSTNSGTGNTAAGGSTGFGTNMFDDFGAATAKNTFGSSTGLDQLQGTDTSNLEGLMASQLQQQQQQLSLQHQLMMVAAQQQQQQQQGDSIRRNSFGAGMGGMDPTLSMQLMMGQQQQQPMNGGMDLQAQQQQQLAEKLQLQQQQQQQQLQMPEQNHDDESGSLDAGAFGGGKPRSASISVPDESKKPRKKKAKTFPEKLMQAITSHGEEDAVAWLPDGKSFVIVNDDLFVEQVLGKVFKESKYTSFVRKLHRYVTARVVVA